MKRVKVCECGKYNHYLAEECNRCGMVLSDFIKRVPKHLTEEEPQKKKDEPQEEKRKTEEPTKKEQKQEKSCPNCKTKLQNIHFVCLECGYKLSGDLNQDDEEKIDLPQKSFCLKIFDDNINEVLTFKENKQTFGRNNMHKEHLYKTISRIHFEYYKEDDYMYIVDVSTNGTYLNGKKLTKKTPNRIYENDQITLANHRFNFKKC